METERIEYIRSNIYIPPTQAAQRPAIPTRHPSLILDDRVGGTTLAPCGCKGSKCIKESYDWLYGPNGEVTNPRSDCHTTEAYHFKTLSHESIGRQL